MTDGSVEGLKKADPRPRVAASGGSVRWRRPRQPKSAHAAITLPTVAKVPLLGSANAAN